MAPVSLWSSSQFISMEMKELVLTDLIVVLS